MIDHDVIERYVDQLLEVNGIPKGTEKQLRLLLSHLYTAVSMFQLLDADSKERVSGLMKILNYNFGAKLVLKERKRKKDKENISPTPPTKEKETKEKDEKNKKNAERFFSAALDERKMAFLLDCERHIERYGKQTVDDFFNYWSEEDGPNGKMLFETKRTWNTAKRLYTWANNEYACRTEAARYRLAKTKQGRTPQSTAADKAAAKEREALQAKRELERAENKKKAITFEEYLERKNQENA
jgi:hypothetical protein